MKLFRAPPPAPKQNIQACRSQPSLLSSCNCWRSHSWRASARMNPMNPINLFDTFVWHRHTTANGQQKRHPPRKDTAPWSRPVFLLFHVSFRGLDNFHVFLSTPRIILPVDRWAPQAFASKKGIFSHAFGTWVYRC